jgi:acetyltransferase-like isoleucine patch superfamily enzyme
MKLLLLNYFSLKAIIFRLTNLKFSFFSIFDKLSKISKTSKINRFSVLRNSVVGDFSFIGPSCTLLNTTIGKFCGISKGVNLGAPIHPTQFISTSPIFYREVNGTGTRWVLGKKFDDKSGSIFVGNDVWIGFGASIMGGVTIGDGAIIGAHALVTKDVPPYAIVGGVPARVIRYRFSEEVIKLLLELRWWDIPEPKLKKHLDFFSTNVTVETICSLKSLLFPIGNDDE